MASLENHKIPNRLIRTLVSCLKRKFIKKLKAKTAMRIRIHISDIISQTIAITHWNGISAYCLHMYWDRPLQHMLSTSKFFHHLNITQAKYSCSNFC